jgi:hypothetical protein
MSASRQGGQLKATMALGCGLEATCSAGQLHAVFPQRTFERPGSTNLPSCIIMALNPRIWQPIALAVLACHRAAPSVPPPAPCGPYVPRTAQHPIASGVAALVGDYVLTQVRTQPVGGETSSGRLHLMPLDSATRAVAAGGAVRDLSGWLETANGDSAWRSSVGSRDPAYPGVVLAGDHLQLGQSRLDGYSEHLTITAVSPEGFWGWWKAEPGLNVTMDAEGRRVLPDPAGYFCALRVTPQR